MTDVPSPYVKLQCPCGAVAITTCCGIPACAECDRKYGEEGRKYLPMSERTFFRSFIDKAREQDFPSATGFTFYGY